MTTIDLPAPPMTIREPRCLNLDHLAWPVKLTIRTPHGVAVISHVVPRQHSYQRVSR
jgi:hypothetical protein